MDLLGLFKSCPACASGNLRVDKAKAIVCGRCQFTYYHNTAAAVAAIIECGSRIIITRRANQPHAHMLDLPGGFADYDENAEHALAREVHEELNLTICNLKYLTSAPNTYLYENVLYHILDIFFTCQTTSLDDIRPRDDVLEYLLLEPSRIPLDELAFASTKTALAYYLANRQTPQPQ